MLPIYSELHCISNFSFLQGASHPQELVERASTLGYKALALTDECSVAGIVRAHLAAKDHAIKFIVGSEFRLVEGLRVVLLACNRDGYGNLCELITRGRRAATKGSYRLSRLDFADGIGNCLALLIPQADTNAKDIGWLAERFPGATWIAVELLRGPDDAGLLERLQALSLATGLPLVAAGDVHMHLRSRKRLQDVLTAIRLRLPIVEVGQALFSNSERYLRPIGRLAHIYHPELLAETLNIAERCNFSLDELRYEYPEELIPTGETPASYLRALTYQGMQRRYPEGAPEFVQSTIRKELQLISELRYEPYFLTVHDIVTFARNNKILCQGRGSAANSAVCFCLGITEVDPGRMDVLFERFISKERNEPPDIDVDFEHQRREEVMQYLFKKYGRERAALTATLITYRPKSALRDVGKALGLSLDQVDTIAKSLAWWDKRADLEKRLQEVGFEASNKKITQLLELVDTLIGFPRHLSQHTGGFVLTRDKLSRLVPIENAAMEDRTVIEWDKDDLDHIGLLKVDVLALGMLSAIRRALDLVNDWRGTRWTMATLPAEDPKVYEMICHADTIGVFQIESRAQMSMLPRLQPRQYYDLVIEVAIVRPGPIQGGMVHPYLRRRAKIDPVTYPSKIVEKVLERTLGIPIFQEQVMRLAVVAAGFTPGEADQLRRAMAAWRRKGGLEPFRDKLLSGMLARGYQAQFAEQLYAQICGFGEYGFPESHAASFALLVYVSSWLKCHEPAAFGCALLNSQPLGFYSPSQIVQDVRRHQVEVRTVDVTISQWDCTLEQNSGDDPSLRLGLRLVKGLSETIARGIVKARTERSFDDIDDLADRAFLDRRSLDCLAAADALHTLAGHRRCALWQTMGVELDQGMLTGSKRDDRQPDLLPPSEGENIVADYSRLGLTLRRHPLALLRKRLHALKLKCAHDVQEAEHGQSIRVAGIVTCRQRPGTASGAVFVTLEDETGYINVIVWSALVERQRKELLGASLMGVMGTVERQGEVVHVIAGKLEDHSRLLGRLAAPSRDFH